MAYIDISSFIDWFITQFVNIGTQIINLLDNIKIYNTVSILDLIITIVIIGVFLELILTIPQNSMNGAKNNIKEYKAEQRRKERKKK